MSHPNIPPHIYNNVTNYVFVNAQASGPNAGAFRTENVFEPPPTAPGCPNSHEESANAPGPSRNQNPHRVYVPASPNSPYATHSNGDYPFSRNSGSFSSSGDETSTFTATETGMMGPREGFIRQNTKITPEGEASQNFPNPRQPGDGKFPPTSNQTGRMGPPEGFIRQHTKITPEGEASQNFATPRQPGDGKFPPTSNQTGRMGPPEGFIRQHTKITPEGKASQNFATPTQSGDGKFPPTSNQTGRMGPPEGFIRQHTKITPEGAASQNFATPRQPGDGKFPPTSNQTGRMGPPEGFIRQYTTISPEGKASQNFATPRQPGDGKFPPTSNQTGRMGPPEGFIRQYTTISRKAEASQNFATPPQSCDDKSPSTSKQTGRRGPPAGFKRLYTTISQESEASQNFATPAQSGDDKFPSTLKQTGWRAHPEGSGRQHTMISSEGEASRNVATLPQSGDDKSPSTLKQTGRTAGFGRQYTTLSPAGTRGQPKTSFELVPVDSANPTKKTRRDCQSEIEDSQSDKDAPTAITMAIYPHSYPICELSQEEGNDILIDLLREISEQRGNAPAISGHHYFRKGLLVFEGCSEEAVTWLEENIPKVPHKRGFFLKCDEWSRVRDEVVLVAHVTRPYDRLSPKEVLHFFELQCNSLKTKEWRIVRILKHPTENQVVLAMPEDDFKEISKNGMKLQIGMGNIQFTMFNREDQDGDHDYFATAI